MSSRATRAEIMDDPATDPQEIARAFRFIRWVNRRLGGSAGLIARLEELRHSHRGPLRLLDVGAGCADIPLAALAWAARCGVDLHIVAVDRLKASLDDAERVIGAHPLSRDPSLTERLSLVEGDAFELDERFEPGSFHVVHAAMFLHHFTDEQVVALLRIMGRLASKLVVWNDLSRDIMSRAVVRVMTLPLPRTVRHDAVLSVDKGFRPQEVRELVRRAGLSDPRIERRWLHGRFVAAIPILQAHATPTREVRTGSSHSVTVAGEVTGTRSCPLPGASGTSSRLAPS